jgi:lipopolysaccharide transport system ATP-binding protein
MSAPIVSINKIGKCYRLGTASRHNTLRDQLADGVRQLFSRDGRHQKGGEGSSEFWALKDVSFEIHEGEVLGVIGRNGAGKSTLLKVLSLITEPTEGEIRLRGRVASLLEVGTGFHPELSGRENVYLNGAILGMSKDEIRRKFDEIVAFAEVEKFLDTPVKRYSSGMYVRLAFSVAAHLEPEILIIDEVLAVGDAAFQKKCLGRMQDVGKAGRTVIFVSHNMSIIQSLCHRCVVMQGGRLVANETAAGAVQYYLRDSSASNSFVFEPKKSGNPSLVSGNLQQLDDCIQIVLGIATVNQQSVAIDLRLADGTGNPVAFGSLGTLDSRTMTELQPGSNSISFSFPTGQLATGAYFVSIDLTLPFSEYYDRCENCFNFENVRPAAEGTVRLVAQSWGYGSFELPMTRCPNPPSGTNDFAP